MENILPGFSHSRRREDELIDEREYDRRMHTRPMYGGYEYTGQPAGFEHLGSPPRAFDFEDMDPKTIAQLGYEGPEGERRKVEAINEQIYEREYEREGYRNGVPIEGYRYREGYPDEYARDRQRVSGQSGHSTIRFRDRREEEEYRRTGRLYDDPRYVGTRGHVVPIPVQVERKFEEDGTIVENVYPDNTVASLYSPRDPGKIHYGRQDSFPETALQEAAESAYRHARYAGRYRDERLPPSRYGPPYADGTSYARGPYEGSSSEYSDDRRRY
jgi:hypothetical protein